MYYNQDFYNECEKCGYLSSYTKEIDTGAIVCIECAKEYEESKIDYIDYLCSDR